MRAKGPAKPIPTLRCSYCGSQAVYRATSEHIFGTDYGPVWECAPCRARVGVHKGTRNPLGTLANAPTRDLRQRAHAVFDPLWRAKMKRDQCSQSKAREAAYAWLATLLEIPVERCHISWFQADELNRVIDLCTRRPLPRLPTKAAQEKGP